MHTIVVRTRYILLTIGIVFLLLTRGQYVYETRAGNDSHIEKKLSQRTDDVEVKYYTIDGKSIRYVDLGDKNNPMLVLFHGAPGGISTWYKLLEHTTLLERYRIIVIDRPGYGKSGAGRAVTSLEEQAKLLAPLLDLNQHTTKPILIGHSLGPAIVAKMAVMYPEKIGGLVFIAGAVDPEHETIWLASYPMNRKIFRRMIAPPLRVTNREKLTHVAELHILKEEWPNITHPLTVMHGNADRIVPVENAYFVEQHATNAQIDMRIQPERNHFLPFDRTGEVEKAIDDMYSSLSDS